MSVKDYLKEETKRERQKLSRMCWKDRGWYIWEYYKLHILGIAVLLGLLISIGTTVYRSQFKTGFYCMVLGSRSPEGGGSEDLEQTLELYMGMGKKESLVIDDSLMIRFDGASSQYDYAALAKITALISAGDLDVMIADASGIDHFAGMDGYMSLEELPEEVYDRIRDRLYYAKGGDGAKRPYAVSLDSADFQDQFGMKLDAPILAVMSNTRHKDRCVSLIRYLFRLP